MDINLNGNTLARGYFDGIVNSRWTPQNSANLLVAGEQILASVHCCPR